MKRGKPKDEFVQARVTAFEKQKITAYCEKHQVSIAEILLKVVARGR